MEPAPPWGGERQPREVQWEQFNQSAAAGAAWLWGGAQGRWGCHGAHQPGAGGAVLAAWPQGALRSRLQTQGKVKLQLWSFQSPLPTWWIWAQLSRPHCPWSVLSGCPGAQKLCSCL